MTLIRWDPWRELDALRRGVDRFFETDLVPHVERLNVGNLALDVEDKEDTYVVTASVPGFTEDEVNVSVTGRNVTISAESKREGERKEEGYVVRERHWGSLSRSFSLPSDVDAEKAAAEQKNGILTLTFPKSATERTKKISIKAT